MNEPFSIYIIPFVGPNSAWMSAPTCKEVLEYKPLLLYFAYS